jgi:hypothetical protein
VKYASDGRDTIHMAYTEGHPRDFDNSVYHVALRAGVLHRSDGTPIRSLEEGLRAPHEGTRVFTGDPGHVAWVVDLELDAEGRPVIAYSVQKGSAGLPRGQGGDDHRYRIARWTGETWTDEEIAFAGTRLYSGEDDYTGGIALVPGDPTTVFISTDAHPETGVPLVSATDGRRHWEIYRGTRSSGANEARAAGTATEAGSREPSWRWTALTEASTSDNLRPIVPRAEGREPILLWLRGTYRSFTDYDLVVVGRLGPSGAAGAGQGDPLVR